MQRHEKIARDIYERILQGAYAFRDFPSDRELAKQSQASYMTARRAVQSLVDKNILSRNESGRVEIAQPDADAHPLRIAFLTPAFVSDVFSMWHLHLRQAAESIGAVLRPLTYVHWDDFVLRDALTGFDGVFLVPVSEPLPPAMADFMRTLHRPPVILSEDFSVFGLPSVSIHPPRCTQLILDHLAERGHRRIDCLNVQPPSPESDIRIRQWRLWMETRGFEGELLDFPTENYASTLTAGYERMKRHWERGASATALYCVTIGAAIGAYRAMYERGWTPGREVALAVVDGEYMAPVMTPSLTSIAMPDPTPLLRLCCKWIRGGGPWSGPLLLQIPEIAVTARESSRATASLHAAAGDGHQGRREPALSPA